MKRHAVITGLGIVSPIGVGIEEFWASAVAGRSGIGFPSRFDASKLPHECRLAGEVLNFDAREWMPGVTVRMAGRFSHFAVAASRMAQKDSRIDLDAYSDQVKVCIGSSMNGLCDVHQPNFTAFLDGRSVAPWTSLEFPAHAATSHVATASGIRGQTVTFATACAAGLDAVGWSAEEIQQGRARAVIAGATEAPLSAATMAGFHAAGVLSRWDGPPAEASRPFDRLRSGLVMAEGAAAVFLEEDNSAVARRAYRYGRVLGFASVSEGGNLRKIDQSGEAAARAMAMALASADLAPRDIDYVSAHGNSMTDYDAAETRALKKVFGRFAWNIPVSSLKSMCGQALAASSAMQVVVACLTLRDQLAHPTINQLYPDPVCDLDYVPNRARSTRVRNILIHAHSIGGSHAALVLGAAA